MTQRPVNSSTGRGTPDGGGARQRPLIWLFLCGLLIVVVVILLPRPAAVSRGGDGASNGLSLSPAGVWTATGPAAASPRRRDPAVRQTPEEIVSGKLSQFGRSRRDIAHAIGRRSKKEVPPEVEKFFDAVEGGRWDEIEASWKGLARKSGQYENSVHAPELDEFWPPVLEAYGAAEAVHLWPAQKLLDYGDAVLGSLRPGMVYVGGTDPGRFIPTMLNETSDGEQHIILTQNALADGRYQEYLRFLYGDRFGLPTGDESQAAFQDYVQDAQKRLLHDQQFPDEPKQVRPGEKIAMSDGRVQVSGQVAVMGVNERLLQIILDKNPGAAFALEESFPMKNTYPGAVPLGPLMELRSDASQTPFTSDTASQALDYLRGLAQQVQAGSDGANNPDVLKTYAHMANAQANLFADHHFNDQAEQAYKLATSIWPDNIEAVKGYSEFLAGQGRGQEATQILDAFAKAYPKQNSELQIFRGSITFTAPPGAK